MNFKRIIIFLTAVLGMLPVSNLSAAAPKPFCTLEDQSAHYHRPQWSDLGMDHLLAVSGQINLASPLRLVSHGRRLASGNNQTAGGINPNPASPTSSLRHKSPPAIHHPASLTPGYIYIIQCLRL